jgi:endoglycosylceramidase
MKAIARCLALLVTVAACTDDGTVAPASQPPTSWSVASGFLRDANGRAVILRGANVSGHNKYAPWFDFQGPADFTRMRDDWGMNAVRFLVSWAAIEPTQGQYDAAYLDAVAQRITWARDANLYVIVDMHQDVYGLGFESGGGDGAPLWTCAASNYAGFMPTTPWALESLESGVTTCFDDFWHGATIQSHYAEAWRRVAARLSGFDNVVGFDPFNEPYWGSHPITHFEPDLLSPFYETLVPIVRSAAPGWVAFLEPSAARNLGGTTYLSTPTFSNFAYSPHSYDTGAESGDGFDPSHAPALISNIAALASEAKALGATLWIGEYGGSADESGITQYMKAQYDGMGAVAASATYWDYSKGGYGLLNVDGSEAQPLLDSVIRPYPERTAGDPIAWSFDEASSTFTMSYHARSSVSASTIVSIAPRLYPKGYTFECGGCQATAAMGSLTITTPPTGDPAVVTIRPKT